MTNYRTQGSDSFSIGTPPPVVNWTIIRGDTSAFRVYVTDENRNPLVISEWTIRMDIKRPSTSTVILSLTPEVTAGDDDGEFTVSLAPGSSRLLETDDIFDIQLSDGLRVWTVCTGTVTVIEDVTQ